MVADWVVNLGVLLATGIPFTWLGTSFFLEKRRRRVARVISSKAHAADLERDEKLRSLTAEDLTWLDSVGWKKKEEE